MKNDMDWDLILGHLQGSNNLQDQQKFHTWLDQDGKNRELMEKLQKIWNSPDEQMPDPDTDSAWQGVIEKAGIDLREGKNESVLRLITRPRIILDQLLGNKMLRLAAVVIFAAVLSFLAYNWNRPLVLQELRVPLAQKMTVTLSDGSKIVLDAGSYLEYPEEFRSAERQVYFNGEGYFEVNGDPDKPFVIHTGESIIRVLGTRFNIRTWPYNKLRRVSLTVVEGLVSFQADGAVSEKNTVVVSEREYSELLENQPPTMPKSVNIEEYISWVNREINFRNAPLREVLDQLERWYDIQIELEDHSLAKNRVALFVDNKSLQDILEVIALMNNMQYEQKGRTILFKKPM
jgi:ferric-dicitrate binding protein FerR (iron transport regulator)